MILERVHILANKNILLKIRAELYKLINKEKMEMSDQKRPVFVLTVMDSRDHNKLENLLAGEFEFLNFTSAEEALASLANRQTPLVIYDIAKRAKSIFISSEVEEKRQFLGFLLQNCVLNGKNLEFSLRSPFNLILNSSDNLTLR